MSLILDALKKADKDRQKPGSEKIPINPIVPDKKTSRIRLVLLLTSLAMAIGLFVYLRYFKKGAPFHPELVKGPSPIAALSPGAQSHDPEILKSEGLKLFQENRLEESLQIWNKLTLLLPTEAEIYNNQGLTLKKLGKKEEARKAYEKALALKENYAEALNNMGVLLLSDGNKTAAKQNFQKAIEIDKNYPDPYFNLALIYEQEGNIKMAITAYGQFLGTSKELDPELRQKIEKKRSKLEQQP